MQVAILTYNQANSVIIKKAIILKIMIYVVYLILVIQKLAYAYY
jgi:hypothetical protein